MWASAPTKKLKGRGRSFRLSYYIPPENAKPFFGVLGKLTQIQAAKLDEATKFSGTGTFLCIGLPAVIHWIQEGGLPMILSTRRGISGDSVPAPSPETQKIFLDIHLQKSKSVVEC